MNGNTHVLMLRTIAPGKSTNAPMPRHDDLFSATGCRITSDRWYVHRNCASLHPSFLFEMANISPGIDSYVKRGPTLGGSVIILCPGGLEQGGGIGRQMGYFLRACHSGERRDLSRGRFSRTLVPRRLAIVHRLFGSLSRGCLAPARESPLVRTPLCYPRQHHRARQHCSKGGSAYIRPRCRIALPAACPRLQLR